MHYKAPEVKGMKVAVVREQVCEYINAVQPVMGEQVMTDILLTAVRTRSTDLSPEMKWFMGSERLIAEETHDFRIHDMILYLRQVDRNVKNKGIA